MILLAGFSLVSVSASLAVGQYPKKGAVSGAAILGSIMVAVGFFLFLIWPAGAASIRVVDGDTLHYNRETVRVWGIDAPEIRGKCTQEHAQAVKARDRMTELLSPPHRVRIARLWTKHKPKHVIKDKYGRTLAVLYSDGRKVGDILTSENLAAPYYGTGAKRDWCKAGGRR